MAKRGRATFTPPMGRVQLRPKRFEPLLCSNSDASVSDTPSPGSRKMAKKPCPCQEP